MGAPPHEDRARRSVWLLGVGGLKRGLLTGHICPTAIEGIECSVLAQAINVARAYLA